MIFKGNKRKNCISLLCLLFCFLGCRKPSVSNYSQLNGTTWVPATLEQTGLGGFGGFIASLKFFDKRFKLSLPMLPGMVITGTYSRSGDKLKFAIDDVQDITISGEFFGNDSLVLDIDNEENVVMLEFIRKQY